MGGAMPVWVNHHNQEDAENQGEQTSIEPTMTAQKHAWHVQKDTSIHDTALIGDVMTESELWACTTCRTVRSNVQSVMNMSTKSLICGGTWF